MSETKIDGPPKEEFREDGWSNATEIVVRPFDGSFWYKTKFKHPDGTIAEVLYPVPGAPGEPKPQLSMVEWLDESGEK